MMTAVNENNNDKAKVPDEFFYLLIYRSVSLVCFTTELDVTKTGNGEWGMGNGEWEIEMGN